MYLSGNAEHQRLSRSQTSVNLVDWFGLRAVAPSRDRHSELQPNREHKHHVGIIFDNVAACPPDASNMKVFYISREMLRRGIQVTWVQLGGKERRRVNDGIELLQLSSPGIRIVGTVLGVLKILKHCLSSQISIVYVDEWLFFRRRPTIRLILQVMLRIGGIRFIFDQRDPFIDYEVANGQVREGSFSHCLLQLQYRLIYRLCSLIVLPSRAYVEALQGDGVPRSKLLGTVRGVDQKLFKPMDDPSELKNSLGISDKFVVGFFGHMSNVNHEVSDVIVPLIMNLPAVIPNSFVLVGGGGDPPVSFDQLKLVDPPLPYRYLGRVPYSDLPKYLAACDVLLCPVSPLFKITRLSGPLKILETIAMGRPILVSYIKAKDEDYAHLKGVIWTGSKSNDFVLALDAIHSNYRHFLSEAAWQAAHIEDYTILNTISRIVDRAILVSQDSRFGH